MKNYYEILEVNSKASEQIIKKVFKIHVKNSHPDLFTGDEKLKAEEKLKLINEAYEVLSNLEKRKEYDEKLAQDLSNLNEPDDSNQDLDTLTKLENMTTYTQNLKEEIDILKLQLEERENFIDDVLSSINVHNPFKRYEYEEENLTFDQKFHKYLKLIKNFSIKVLIAIIMLVISFILIYFLVWKNGNFFFNR